MTIAAPTLTLLEAKERVRIPDLWREFGYHGESGKTCFCPFHENTRTPAFSVFDDGKLWKCHTGCGEGSVIDFLAKAKGLSDEEARLEILRRAGGTREVIRSERAKRELAVLELPPLVPYSKEIAQRVADSRGLGIAAVEFAALWLKTVVFARVCEQNAWILTDASRKCAEARRLDAKPFPAIGTLKERKSHALAGSRKSWPVGILPPAFDESWLKEHVHNIILVEGGPDYLAACQIIAAHDASVLPVAMLVSRALRRASADGAPERAALLYGGIFAGLIDGVGDFAIDVNDLVESNGLVAELHSLAIRFDCPIVCVLHENPGENSHGKTRGHLGSQLEHKAESNLRLVKDPEGVTTIFSEKSRHANISKERGPRFKWNDAEKLHRTCETMRDAKGEQRCKTLRIFVEEIFNCPEATGGLTWTQAHERIEKLESLKRSGARRRFDGLIAARVMEKNSAGFYMPTR
jgi:hypothetical protein